MSEPDTNACERWATVADRRLLEEAVSDEDATFSEDHLRECELCRAEAGVWDELPALESSHAEALVERALGGLKRDPEPPISLDAARRRRFAIGSGIAAALAVAAAAAIWVRSGDKTKAPFAPTATLASVRGEVTIDGQPARDGAPIRVGARVVTAQGRACIEWNQNARACLDDRSAATVTSSLPEARSLELTGGTVVASLDRLPPGHRFVVSAGESRVSVKGTIFSVTRQPTRPVVVRVHQGVVAAESPNASRDVAKNQELEIGRATLGDVPLDVRRHELEVVGVQLHDPTPKPTAKLEPTLPNPDSDAGDTKPGPAAAPNAADLLKEARTLRAQGNAAGAASAYRRLQAQHPRSAEAQASRVSLAELMLGPLGDPSGALAAYDSYLRGGGALRQEARYGRILALRRLGRSGEANTAVDAFLKDYPNSVQARALTGKANDAGTK